MLTVNGIIYHFGNINAILLSKLCAVGVFWSNHSSELHLLEILAGYEKSSLNED